MPADEAFNILNIDSKQLNREIVEEQFKKYFASNDPGKGGSFYLQSKIFRAKEALDRELRKKAATSSSSSSSSTTTK